MSEWTSLSGEMDYIDDERFCPACKAGVESCEHLTSPCGEWDR